MKYKVVIPSAGLGTRLKNLSKHVNKSLVTVGNKPVISHIIEKFPIDVEIIIPVGYKKETVIDYLKFAHPERKIKTVNVNLFEGKGSGLGYSLLKCEGHLQCPFIFCANDTMVIEQIPEPENNWMGYALSYNTEDYRAIQFDKQGIVADILSKGSSGDNVKPYIGLAGIYDYELFWKAMNNGREQGSIEIGESYGLKFLLKRNISARSFTWYDIGNLDSLEKVRDFYRSDSEPNILEKPDEAIWFVNGKVIKFSIDSKFISNRVKRTKYLGNYVPRIIGSSENMYVYEKVDGEIFSKNPTVEKFKYFLDWMDTFWVKKKLSKEEEKGFYKKNLEFYKDKTFKRVHQYFERFEQIDSKEIINVKETPKLMDILIKVDWDDLARGFPTRYHGDLHFENILINANNTPPFTLLDWRQDFGGNLEYGDIYYDFAKLNHGLIICHELVNKNFYEVHHKLSFIDFDFLRKSNLVECEIYFKEYIKEKGFDWKKVEILTALIFLNIAALHHYPYSSLLFYLGKSSLYKGLTS
ncbi:MAG: hypothetical protein HQ543_05095 [Bacteroidetes bacterium]|nr:hypothetical protein [Bacteroidota bacterium]